MSWTAVMSAKAMSARLLRLLGERYPASAPHLAEGYAIPIDGKIGPDSELHLMPDVRWG